MIRIMKAERDLSLSLHHYQLPLKQMRFAGHPAYVINRQRKDYEPYVIFKDDEIIGVFALETGRILKTLGAPDNAVYLRGLSIDAAHQGKGYFKHIISAVEQLKRDAAAIYLMVNVNNDAAYYAFIKSGFTDEKRMVTQGLSKLKVLSKAIKNKPL